MDWSIVGPAVFNVAPDWGDSVGTPCLGLPTLEGADKRSAESFYQGLPWQEEEEEEGFKLEEGLDWIEKMLNEGCGVMLRVIN